MIYRYEIRKNKNKEVLYLYLTMKYEFSNEFDKNSKNTEVIKKAKEFIKNNSITYNGNEVYLIVDGIVVNIFNLNEENSTTIISDIDYSNNNYIINLKDNDIIKKITLKNYLLGILATNCIPNLELTTLKALCILYRTYAYKQMKKNDFVLINNEFQIYKPIEYYKLLWSYNYSDIYNKLEKAINDTDNEFITYNNHYILPFIHICNNGITNNHEKYKYLKSVNSSWDYTSPYYINVNDYSYETLSNLLNQPNKDLKKIKVLELNKDKQIDKIKIGNKMYTGKEFRNKLYLKSADINIIINPTYIRIINKGFGNNYGLSQYSANELAKAGCSYKTILNYFFNKIVIKKYTK